MIKAVRFPAKGKKTNLANYVDERTLIVWKSHQQSNWCAWRTKELQPDSAFWRLLDTKRIRQENFLRGLSVFQGQEDARKDWTAFTQSGFTVIDAERSALFHVLITQDIFPLTGWKVSRPILHFGVLWSKSCTNPGGLPNPFLVRIDFNWNALTVGGGTGISAPQHVPWHFYLCPEYDGQFCPRILSCLKHSPNASLSSGKIQLTWLDKRTSV